MKYFQVPLHMDGRRVFRMLANGQRERTLTPVRELVLNELYTERELSRLGLDYIKPQLQAVEVSRKKIYWSFGARFAW